MPLPRDYQRLSKSLFFFFNHPETTEIYTLSLHDALPISRRNQTPLPVPSCTVPHRLAKWSTSKRPRPRSRSEEHTSELQSHSDLVCRLLLEKKKNTETRNRLSICWSDTTR